ncbi:uncharacterized protein LOC119652261 [Hermetia illucens]|uniref:uncharacterized protein LOC119652261 n=1 Tax=Hermetia illucens TaxID=343691 RepID=UPI0018CC1612|nr:uncharacterized protein LOC119652261 [Hermetia illucens]
MAKSAFHGDTQFTFGDEDLTAFERFVAGDFSEFGHLLPGNIVNPQGSSRGPGGPGQSFMYSPGHRQLGGYGTTGLGMSSPSGGIGGFGIGGDYSSHGIGTGASPDLGLVGVTGGLFDYSNPYDGRITCGSRCYCPGGGLGLPCCSLTDVFTGGHFRLINCPEGMCTDYY